MGRHVIVGAGPVGTATARALVAAGHEVTLVMARLVDAAARSGELEDPPWSPSLVPMDPDTRDAVSVLIDLAFPAASPATAVRALAAWTQLFGIISFELFGHFHRVVDEVSPVFDRALLEMGRHVGLPAPWTAGRTASDADGSAPDADDEAFYLI